jgi:hypothetical protein
LERLSSRWTRALAFLLGLNNLGMDTVVQLRSPMTDDRLGPLPLCEA